MELPEVALTLANNLIEDLLNERDTLKDELAVYKVRTERYLRQISNPWTGKAGWLVCIACGELYDKHAKDCEWKKLKEKTND